MFAAQRAESTLHNKTLLVFDDCPMERQQIPQVMSRFSAALFRACKQVPCFAEGTFDKDKLYNDELG